MPESEITICNSFIQNRLDEGTDQKSICPLSFLDALCYRSNYKALLKDALTKIKNLEEEMAHFRQNSNNNFLYNKSHSKSDICRHWLRNQCTWQQKCRFSRGGGANSTFYDSNKSNIIPFVEIWSNKEMSHANCAFAKLMPGQQQVG